MHTALSPTAPDYLWVLMLSLSLLPHLNIWLVTMSHDASQQLHRLPKPHLICQYATSDSRHKWTGAGDAPTKGAKVHLAAIQSCKLPPQNVQLIS